MKKYLLDSNIIIFLFKDKHDMKSKIKTVGERNVFVSEITIAELKFGAENSDDASHRQKNRETVENFQSTANIVPIFPALDVYAKEKARLNKLGTRLDDFDLLIGTTAVFNNMIMVTNNVKHLGRINGIVIEDWTTA